MIFIILHRTSWGTFAILNFFICFDTISMIERLNNSQTNKRLAYNADLSEPEWSQKKIKNSFRCLYKQCNTEYSDYKSLQSHYFEHIGNGKVQENKCKWGECGKLLRGMQHCHKRLHYKVHFLFFYCSACERGFASFAKLQEHTELKHDKPVYHGDDRYKYKCNKCNRYFINKYARNEHQKSRHYQTKCQVMLPNTNILCGKECMTAEGLYNHLLEHAITFKREKILQCLWKGCKSKTLRVKKHLPIVHSGYSQSKKKCPKCKKLFVDKYYYTNVHFPQCETGKIDRTSCHYLGCSKTYTHIESLKYHLKKEHHELEGDKKFCFEKNCKFSTRYSTLFDNHLKNFQHAEKDLECHWPGCNSGKFNSVKDHHFHILAHGKSQMNRLRNGQCFLCKKSLGTNVTYHLRSHTYYLEFTCDICKRRFAYKGSLKAHIQKAHPEN